MFGKSNVEWFVVLIGCGVFGGGSCDFVCVFVFIGLFHWDYVKLNLNSEIVFCESDKLII